MENKTKITRAPMGSRFLQLLNEQTKKSIEIASCLKVIPVIRCEASELFWQVSQSAPTADDTLNTKSFKMLLPFEPSSLSVGCSVVWSVRLSFSYKGG